MGRTIVKTTTSGWYIDTADPDGSRVRKRDGDEILTREQWEAMKKHLTEAGLTSSVPADATIADIQEQLSRTTPKGVVLADTGKILKSMTVEIACHWVDPEKRNDQIEALLSSKRDPRTVTLAMIEAEGQTPCGASRVINVQDGFQVRFCVQHQVEHRKRRRRQKMAERRKAERES